MGGWGGVGAGWWGGCGVVVGVVGVRGFWLVPLNVFPDFITYQKKDADSYSGIIYDSFSYASYCPSRRADGQKLRLNKRSQM